MKPNDRAWWNVRSKSIYGFCVRIPVELISVGERTAKVSIKPKDNTEEIRKYVKITDLELMDNEGSNKQKEVERLRDRIAQLEDMEKMLKEEQKIAEYNEGELKKVKDSLAFLGDRHIQLTEALKNMKVMLDSARKLAVENMKANSNTSDNK